MDEIKRKCHFKRKKKCFIDLSFFFSKCNKTKIQPKGKNLIHLLHILIYVFASLTKTCSYFV